MEMPFPVPLELIFEICQVSFPSQGLGDDVPEYVNDVTYVPGDQLVAFVDTPGHGYYVLATHLDKDLVLGTIIGEEDRGVDEDIQKKLGWESEYGP